MATGDEGLSTLEGKYDGYTVYDRDGDKIGKVDDLFVDENDREEYIGVKMGLFGLSGTTMIPVEVMRVDENDKSIRVDESKERIKDAPNYSDQEDISADYETRVRQHFGLSGDEASGGRGTYGSYSDSDDEGSRRPGMTSGGDRADAEDQETGREGTDMGRGGYRDEEGAAGASAGTATEDQGGSRGDLERGDDRQGSTLGYRDYEAGDRGEGMGLTSRRRRVRRRSLREENEEIFEEEETSRRPS